MMITSKDSLNLLLSGSTHYIVTAPGKEAAMYYGVGGDAHMLTPDHKHMRGLWRLTPTGYHVDWDGGPSAGWQLDAEPGRIAYLDAGAVERGYVARIVPGDAEALADGQH